MGPDGHRERASVGGRLPGPHPGVAYLESPEPPGRGPGSPAARAYSIEGLARVDVSADLNSLAVLSLRARDGGHPSRRANGGICGVGSRGRRPFPARRRPAARAPAAERAGRALRRRICAADGRARRTVNGRVLVTDGEQRAALAVVRSRGRAGFTPLVAESRSRSLAGVSRFARGRYVVPDALAAPDRFAEAVAGLARELKVDVVLPITDASVLAVLAVRDR